MEDKAKNETNPDKMDKTEEEVVGVMNKKKMQRDVFWGMVRPKTMVEIPQKSSEDKSKGKIILDTREQQVSDVMKSEKVETKPISDEAMMTSSNTEIRRQFPELLNQINAHSAMSEAVVLVGRSRSLNLSGAFKHYPDAKRRRALAFVFKLVDVAAIEDLSLSDNGIDSASLALSLQKVKADSLQGLDLSNNHLQGMEMFCAVKRWQLRRLVLRKNGIGDLGCDNLADAIRAGQLMALEHIDVTANQISDAGIGSLASFLQRRSVPNLREIVLGENDFGDSGVIAIADRISRGDLPLVENIVLLPNRYITDSSMLSLATSFGTGHASHLKILDSEMMPFGPSTGSLKKVLEVVDAGCLKALTKVHLSLASKYMVSLMTSICQGRLVNLEELDVKVIERAEVANIIVKVAEAMHSGKTRLLNTLKLSSRSNMHLQGGDLVSLVVAMNKLHALHNSLQNVQIFSLTWDHSGISWGDPPMHSSPSWGDCDILKLGRAVESGHFMSLRKLDISGSGSITGNPLGRLVDALGKGHLPRLQELLLRNWGWRNNELVKLANAIESGHLEGLQKLDLSHGSCLTSQSPVRLETALSKGCMPILKELHLRCTTFWGHDHIAALAKVIESRSLESLLVLDVSHSKLIDGRSLVHLAVALGKGHLHNLQILLLQGLAWGPGDYAFNKLAEAIASGNLKSLENLDLSGSTGIVGKSLAAALAGNVVRGCVHSLRELSLSNINMGDGDIVELAEAIESGCLWQLETLDVSNAKECGDNSIAKLAKAIGAGHTMQLKRLHLRNIGLGNEGADQLVQAICSGSNVVSSQFGQHAEISTRLSKGNRGHKAGRHPKVPSTSAVQKEESLRTHSQSAQPMKDAQEGTLVEEVAYYHKDSLFHQHDNEDIGSGAGMTPSITVHQDKLQPGNLWSDPIVHGHIFSKDDESDMIKIRDSTDCTTNVAAIESTAGLIPNEFQLRQDVQRLGFKSWDDKWEPGCTLVLADVTSSDEQLHCLFFHTKAMVGLFGCGLPHSRVTIMLDKQLIWIQEMTEESWKAVWMASNEGHLRPFLLEETRIGVGDGGKDLEPEVFHLDKSEALSQFGISVNEPHQQQFVQLTGSTASASRGSKWEPTWICWLRSVINHAFVDGVVPEQLKRRMEDLSVKSPSRTSVSLKGKEIVADETAQEAIPRLQHKVDEGEGEERKLVVMVTFSRPICPFFEYSSNRESAEQIKNNGTLPQCISYIQPELTVEFFRKEKEKCVTTTVEVKYQMRIQGNRWPNGWFQNDLRLSFGSNDSEAYLENHGIRGTELLESDNTRQMGGSSSDQWGMSGEGTLQANFPLVNASGKGSGQWGTTAQTTWSDQNNCKRRKRVLESDDCFGVSSHSYDSTMEGRALFWPAEDPCKFWQPEYRFDQSALRSDVGMKAEAEWDLLGRGTHEYIFEASKELTKCTKNEQGQDEERPSKWLKMPFGKSATGSSNLQDQGAKVTQEKILQIFRKKFLLNHNFDDFFVSYERSGAYKWNIVDESPVYHALRDERVMSGEKCP